MCACTARAIAEVEPRRGGGVAGGEGLLGHGAARAAHPRTFAVRADAHRAGEGAGRRRGEAPLLAGAGAAERLRGESSRSPISFRLVSDLHSLIDRYQMRPVTTERPEKYSYNDVNSIMAGQNRSLGQNLILDLN